MPDDTPAISPALRRLVLGAALVFLVAVLLMLLAWLFGALRARPVAAAETEPQILLVQAVPARDGVLISWDTYQPQALVFRRRFGAYDAFVEVTSGVTLHDAEGHNGDIYGVTAWSSDGTTLVATGAALAEWRVYLPGVGE